MWNFAEKSQVFQGDPVDWSAKGLLPQVACPLVGELGAELEQTKAWLLRLPRAQREEASLEG